MQRYVHLDEQHLLILLAQTTSTTASGECFSLCSVCSDTCRDERESHTERYGLPDAEGQEGVQD